MNATEMMFNDFIENAMISEDTPQGQIKYMLISIQSDEDVKAIGIDPMKLKEFVLQTLANNAEFDDDDEMRTWTYYCSVFGMTFGDEQMDIRKDNEYHHLFKNSIPIDHPLVSKLVNRLEMELL